MTVLRPQHLNLNLKKKLLWGITSFLIGITLAWPQEQPSDKLPFSPTAEDVRRFFENTDPKPAGQDLPELMAPPGHGEGNAGRWAGPVPLNLKRAGGQKWLGNVFTARKKAIREGKYMLLAFGGWDTDNLCSKLAWEVFSSLEFNQSADHSLVLCAVDIPRDQSELGERQRRLKKFYSVKGAPYIILLDPSGEPFFRKIGYQSGKARSYLSEIEAAITIETKRREERRRKLALQGYRKWHSTTDQMLYAKLLGQAPADSTGQKKQGILVQDEYGLRHFIQIANLSDRDKTLLPHLFEIINSEKQATLVKEN